MTDWTALAVISGLIVNALVVAVGYGSLKQQVKDLQKQSDQSAVTVSDNRKSIENKVEHQSHLVLPECQATFFALTSALSEIKGKLDMLVTLTKRD